MIMVPDSAHGSDEQSVGRGHGPVCTPQPPFVWPPIPPDGEVAYRHAALQKLREARAVFGVVHDLDTEGVTELSALLSAESAPTARIVLAVYPACPMSEPVLRQVIELQDLARSQPAFRVLPASSRVAAPKTILCGLLHDESTVVMSGPTALLGGTSGTFGQANIVTVCPPLLLEQLGRWFDAVWAAAAPLTAATAQIPSFVPLQASESAVAAWDAYSEACAVGTVPEPEATPSDVEANGTSADDQPPATPPSVTRLLGLAPLDGLAEEVTRITELGLQVAVDGTTRIQPLHVPIRADLFGIEGSRQLGSIRRETRYRIDAFEPRVQRAIESRRTATSEILRRLCFSLGDGVYWIPRTAIPLLEQEIERVDADGKDRLDGAIKGDVRKYLATQRDRVAADAARAYQEFNPGATLPDSVVDRLLSDLEQRLGAAHGTRFLPQLSYSTMSFRISASTPTASAWGQPLMLLHSIAQFPRRVVTDRRYLLGLQVEESELLAAMDVVGDHLVRRYMARERVRGSAQDELAVIGRIMQSDLKTRARCDAILRVIRHGRGDQSVEKVGAAR